MEKVMERAFNRAMAGHNGLAQDEGERAPKRQKVADEDALLRKKDTPMQAADAIQRILLAEKDKDYFRLLELPPPEVDDLNRPVWACSSADVSKAYRRLSVLVHPDKNPGADARQAFDALSAAHRILRDRGGLEEILKDHLDAARQRREAAEAAATPEERLAMYAAQNDRRKELRKKEGENFQDEILKQTQRRLAEARRKKERLERSRRQNGGEEDGEEEEEDAAPKPSNEASAVVRPQHKSRRGKPKLIF